MSYNILITVHDEMDNEIFTADVSSVDRAIAELGRFERLFPPQGEPGGEAEPELTRAEADERERDAHLHP